MSQIHEIPLDQIRPAPWNPPSRLDPEKVQGLAASIKLEGQKSAALIRPVTETLDGPVKYEIVFGHRRYASKQLLAVDDAAYATLRAEIQEMDEEQAMIISGIENLQREDFSDLEEAEFFRTCGERYGESAVKILAEKLSVSSRYVCKRIEILKLPAAALELWRSGTWHVGHMEQLLRLGDQVEKFMEALKEHRHEPEDLAVWELKETVDRLAISLHGGNFDKADCKACHKNTDCQHRLFGGDAEKGKCLDQECFQTKQQAWLNVNWLTCNLNKFGTQAAVIGDYNTPKTGEFGQYSGPKPVEKCLSCPQFTTIMCLGIHRQGVYTDRVCMGKADCFAEVKKADKQKKNGKVTITGETIPDAPRVSWHGEFFRQQFYQQEIPRLMADLDPDDPRHLQLTLATLLYSARTLHEWFWQEMGQKVVKKEHDWQSFTLRFHQLLTLVQTLEIPRVKALLAEVLVKIALRTDRGYETSFVDADRQALAKFLNIDFGCYQVTQEYLQKKTKAEIIRFIAHDSGLADEAGFQQAMTQAGYPNIEKLAQAKKGVLVDIILKCQVDLHGRLPKEIADRPKLQED